MKDVVGYEGLYGITSCGKVWSYKSQRFLTPCDAGYGYMVVCLRKDGKQTNKRLHRLVAEAYLPNPNGLTDINHKDENKTHNYLNNLEWLNHKENCNYGSRNERIRNKQKGVKRKQ